MGQGISEVLTYAIGVAISPIPIIAVILMLLSRRARVNGPAFLAGWLLGLAIVSAVVYAIANQSDAATNSSTSDSISWGKIALGVVFLWLALRNWRHRPAPVAAPEMPKWMTSIDSFAPGKALGLGVLLSAVNPKNLVLTVGAAAGVAQLGISTGDAVVSLVVFVAVASIGIAGPVVYYVLGGQRAETQLDALKSWLTVHNVAVMIVLFLVLGGDLIAKGLAPLTT
ncbi:MAG TPA: GAP family protein [Acidimicrobiia bacterium]|nr:GAP family protein [Acidimicrobiia bacterium]